MADTGWVLAGSGKTYNAGGTGSNDWSNPGNITADDNAFAVNVQSKGSSYYLFGYSFGLAIPGGATIDGIEARIDRKNTGGVSHDEFVRLTQSATSATPDVSSSTNNADISTPWPTTKATKDYGGPAELWGLTWTDTIVNSADFGLCVRTTGADTSSVDACWIKVTYTTGGGGGGFQAAWARGSNVILGGGNP